jgi:hypothetical protein
LIQEVPKEEDSSVVVPRAERVEEKAILENPAVQSVLDAFGGRVRLEEGAE